MRNFRASLVIICSQPNLPDCRDCQSNMQEQLPLTDIDSLIRFISENVRLCHKSKPQPSERSATQWNASPIVVMSRLT